MTQKKRNPSFDSMVKYFLKHYNIATKQDINRLTQKIEGLQKSLQKMAGTQKSAFRQEKNKSASDVVLNVIKDIGNGAGIADIKAKTDYDDKKLRNIIYRLNKQGKIQRKKRGIYIPE
ncbi:MAG: hypothetical protein KGY38_05180 [Desulfobacterales bacterium]|nr:hypothetical protein [Desulfobacterales bacterium]